MSESRDPVGRELPIPDDAAIDESGFEIARVWAAGGKQHVTLMTGIWEDPANWGVFLVDLAKHVANAYSDTGNVDRQLILDRLKAGFDAEWESETDHPTGQVID